MEKKPVTIGMAGAGRACELHMEALRRCGGVPLRLKMIFSPFQNELDAAKKRWGFEEVTTEFENMLEDPEIDVIDICTIPSFHAEQAISALKAGKHVICEKPLTGYFGLSGDAKLIGKSVSKQFMYEHLLDKLNNMKAVVEKSSGMFMYAENFLYAPAVCKAAELISKKQSKILYLKGEESLRGSSSRAAGEWNRTGGGTFMRTGSHPLAAAIWLKQQEAQARGEEIHVESVFADMEQITPTLSQHERRHINARPQDVEDMGTVIVRFSDGSIANLVACDTLLGGSKNVLELYCNDATINCNLTMNNAMSTYFLDEDGLEDICLSEMLPSNSGWNSPFLSDDIVRGYADEMYDFMSAVYYGRKAKSGFDVAYLTAKVIYAAYLSAEEDKRIYL